MDRIQLSLVGDSAPAYSPITGSEGVQSFIQSTIGDKDREYLVCVHLTAHNVPISWEVVSIGILDCTYCHPREIYKGAILANAASIVIGHNHPSGDPKPSPLDFEITKRMKKAGVILGIPLLDHVIVTPSGKYSFCDSETL